MPSFRVASLDSTTTPALTTSYAVRPVYMPAGTVVMDARNQGIGATERQTFLASVTRDAAGTMTAIVISVQISDDGANPTDATATNWRAVQITNLADNVSDDEHTLSVSAGATATANYGTTYVSNAPYSRVLVKSVTANAGVGDSCFVDAVAN
jgi:hypothetical protein